MALKYNIPKSYNREISSFITSETSATLVKSNLAKAPVLVNENEIKFNETLYKLNSRNLSPLQRKNTALLLLDVCKLLHQYGYNLKRLDHSVVAYNNQGKCFFTGFSSVRKNNNNLFLFSEYFENHIGPLYAISCYPELLSLIQRAENITLNQYWSITHRPIFIIIKILRHFIKSSFINRIESGVLSSRYTALIFTRMYIVLIISIVKDILNKNLSKKIKIDWTINMINKLENTINKINLDTYKQKWTDYYFGYEIKGVFDSEKDWTKHYKSNRALKLIKILRKEKIKQEKMRLLDMGANQGFYSLMASYLGYDVKAVDYDIGAINSLYLNLKTCRHKHNILPIVSDFINLSEYECELLESDIVMALGFTHHMRLVENMSWNKISEKFSRLTKNLLITEFKPNTGASGKWNEIKKDLTEDYQLDNFIEALKNEFFEVSISETVQASGSTSDRILIICKK